MKIKALLDEFFVDLQGAEYSGFSTPIYKMAKENLKVMKYCDGLLSKWEPANMPLEKVHLKLLIDKAWDAYVSCGCISKDSKEYNIVVSEKMKKLLEKTTDSLFDIQDYFEAKNER